MDVDVETESGDEVRVVELDPVVVGLAYEYSEAAAVLRPVCLVGYEL